MHLGEDLHRKFAARALRLAREAHLCLPRAAGHRVYGETNVRQGGKPRAEAGRLDEGRVRREVTRRGRLLQASATGQSTTSTLTMVDVIWDEETSSLVTKSQ